MNHRKWTNSLGLTFISFLVVIPFQNCGHSPSELSGEEDHEVRIIEAWEQMKLSFAHGLESEDMEVSIIPNTLEKVVFIGWCIDDPDTLEKVVFIGWCIDDPDNGSVEWELYLKDKSILAGETPCEGEGKFRVSISEVSRLLHCGKDYYLTAALGEESDEVVIRRDCPIDS